jgi:hypothetical protein
MVTDDDYFEFNKYQVYSAPVYRKNMRLQQFLTPLFFVIFGLIFYTYLHRQIFAYAYGGFALLWIIFYKKRNTTSMKRRLQKMKNFGKLTDELEVTMRFTDDYIIEETADSFFKLKYTRIESVVAGEAAVYVFRRVNTAFIVPNRVFQGATEKDSFVAFIKSKIIKTT